MKNLSLFNPQTKSLQLFKSLLSLKIILVHLLSCRKWKPFFVELKVLFGKKNCKEKTKGEKHKNLKELFKKWLLSFSLNSQITVWMLLLATTSWMNEFTLWRSHAFPQSSPCENCQWGGNRTIRVLWAWLIHGGQRPPLVGPCVHPDGPDGVAGPCGSTSNTNPITLISFSSSSPSSLACATDEQPKTSRMETMSITRMMNLLLWWAISFEVSSVRIFVLFALIEETANKKRDVFMEGFNLVMLGEKKFIRCLESAFKRFDKK